MAARHKQINIDGERIISISHILGEPGFAGDKGLPGIGFNITGRKIEFLHIFWIFVWLLDYFGPLIINANKSSNLEYFLNSIEILQWNRVSRSSSLQSLFGSVHRLAMFVQHFTSSWLRAIVKIFVCDHFKRTAGSRRITGATWFAWLSRLVWSTRRQGR